MRNSIFAALGLVLAAPASADTLEERVTKLPAPTMSSEKSLEALEYCIGLAVSDIAMPATLRGERKVLIYGRTPGDLFVGVLYLVAVQDDGEHRRVAIQAHGSWDGKVEKRARTCL